VEGRSLGQRGRKAREGKGYHHGYEA
jgi:hypothetical protein